MRPYTEFRAATPRVTRMEMADLYVGDSTTVVQLDAIPCETWIENLRALVSGSPELAGTRVEVEGSWVHFTRVGKARGPTVAHLSDLIAAAGAPHGVTGAGGFGSPERGQRHQRPLPGAQGCSQSA